MISVNNFVHKTSIIIATNLQNMLNQLQQLSEDCEQVRNNKKRKEKQMKKKHLFMKKEQRELDQPRTICVNCSSTKNYIPCHEICGLEQAQRGLHSQPALKDCSAMDLSDPPKCVQKMCQDKGCLWTNHMHIFSETVEVEDVVLKKI
jgi:hypothetical protein